MILSPLTFPFFITSEKSTIPCANPLSWSPKSVIDELPNIFEANDAIASTNSAPPKISKVSANALADSATDGSTLEIFSANSAKLFPIAGTWSIIPSPIPPIRLPTNSPIPLAIPLSSPIPLFKKVSKQGSLSTKAPIPIINAPSIVITLIIANAPLAAPSDDGPMYDKAANTAVILKRSIDNDSDISSVFPTCNNDIVVIIPPSIATIPLIIYKDFIAFLFILSDLLTINIEALNDVNNNDIEPDTSIASSIPILDIPAIIVPNNPIMPTIIINSLVDSLEKCVDAIINENALISVANDKVTSIECSGSINDNAPTDIAIKPIAVVITIKFL